MGGGTVRRENYTTTNQLSKYYLLYCGVRPPQMYISIIRCLYHRCRLRCQSSSSSLSSYLTSKLSSLSSRHHRLCCRSCRFHVTFSSSVISSPSSLSSTLLSSCHYHRCCHHHHLVIIIVIPVQDCPPGMHQFKRLVVESKIEAFVIVVVVFVVRHHPRPRSGPFHCHCHCHIWLVVV